MATMKTDDSTNAGGDMKTVDYMQFMWGYQMLQLFWKIIRQSVKKLSIQVSFDPEVELLDLYHR